MALGVRGLWRWKRDYDPMRIPLHGEKPDMPAPAPVTHLLAEAAGSQKFPTTHDPCPTDLHETVNLPGSEEDSNWYLRFVNGQRGTVLKWSGTKDARSVGYRPSLLVAWSSTASPKRLRFSWQRAVSTECGWRRNLCEKVTPTRTATATNTRTKA